VNSERPRAVRNILCETENSRSTESWFVPLPLTQATESEVPNELHRDSRHSKRRTNIEGGLKASHGSRSVWTPRATAQWAYRGYRPLGIEDNKALKSTRTGLQGTPIPKRRLTKSFRVSAKSDTEYGERTQLDYRQLPKRKLTIVLHRKCLDSLGKHHAPKSK